MSKAGTARLESLAAARVTLPAVLALNCLQHVQNPSAPPIILASSSSYRRGLLDRVLTEYQAVSPGVNESREGEESPRQQVERLAREKAEAVASKHARHLVIGADQLAVVEQRVLGKPGNHQEAVDQLMAASGKALQFLTAVCLLDPVERGRHEHVNETVVRFRRFDRRLAENYLRHDKPYDCAGSFRIEGAGFVLLESVATEDPTALIGLPMIWLSGQLQELGYLLS